MDMLNLCNKYAGRLQQNRLQQKILNQLRIGRQRKQIIRFIMIKDNLYHTLNHIISKNPHYDYLDSSQEENQYDEVLNYIIKNDPNRNKAELEFEDSSSQQQQQNQQSSNPYQSSQSSAENMFRQQNRELASEEKRKLKHKCRKICKVNSDEFLLNDNYIQKLQKIVQQNKKRLQRKAPLLIADTDKQILQNLQKRSMKYGHFLKTVEIDKRYNELLQKKVNKLKQQNQRKGKVLQKKKANTELQQEEQSMKKYVLDRKLKQQIVIDKIQKYSYKLGMQRIRLKQKQIKKQVEQIKTNNHIKVVNMQVKQNNQLQQLREQLQNIKSVNRANKLQQKKVIKEMKVNNRSSKQFLLTKAQSMKDVAKRGIVI